MRLNLSLPHELEWGSYSIIKRGGSCRRLVPDFIYNDLQTRHVLVLRAWRWLHKRKPAPPDLVSKWRDLDVEATATLMQQRKKIMFGGSYLAGVYAVAYAAWRTGATNRDLAEKYGVSSTVIEKILFGLIDAAKILGYPTGSKTPRKDQTRKRPKGVMSMADYKKTGLHSKRMMEVWATKRAHQLNPFSERRRLVSRARRARQRKVAA